MLTAAAIFGAVSLISCLYVLAWGYANYRRSILSESIEA